MFKSILYQIYFRATTIFIYLRATTEPNPQSKEKELLHEFFGQLNLCDCGFCVNNNVRDFKSALMVVYRIFKSILQQIYGT